MKYLYCLLIILVLSGCSLTPNYITFDLDRNYLQDSPNLGINVNPRFISALPSSPKMIFYFKGNEVKYDMFNNWSQTPQELIPRYLMLFFNNPAKKVENTSVKGCTISGTIYDFECDTVSNEAIFTVEITIADKDENVLLSKLYSAKTKLQKLTASDFASAMSLSVYEVEKQIYSDIKNLKERKQLNLE